MGRAKNLPVGGKSAGVHNLCLLACAPVGGDPSPCGAQDDSVRGMLNLFVGVPACGGRSSLPLAGASEPPAGVRMTHAGVGRDGINNLNQARQQNGPRLWRTQANTGSG